MNIKIANDVILSHKKQNTYMYLLYNVPTYKYVPTSIILLFVSFIMMLAQNRMLSLNVYVIIINKTIIDIQTFIYKVHKHLR